jgi:virulence-associated protein VapD
MQEKNKSDKLVLKKTGDRNMYAITFDMDTKCLGEEYNQETYHGAYAQIAKFLENKGFTWKQGSMYFSENIFSSVEVAAIAFDLAKEYPWFAECVKDIQMLEIHEYSDLMPMIQRAKK